MKPWQPALSYLSWQLRDQRRTVLVMAGIAVLVVLIGRGFEPGADESAELAAGLLRTVMGQAGWPLVLLLASGMVSGDRTEGYFRMLFSAPVDPLQFYLQKFLVGAVTVALLPFLMAAAIGLSIGTTPAPWEQLAVLELTYLALGGLVFCWSTFMRRDWIIGLAIFIFQGVIGTMVESGATLPGWLHWAHRLLQPFHLVKFGGLIERAEFPTGMEWFHYIGYALGVLILAGVIIRKRPMAEGGRG